MKIGILTFHRALNYGAVLQCYALFNTLAEMGHDVEVIDYRPQAIEKYRMLFRWKNFASKDIIGKIRYIASSLVVSHSKLKTASKFDGFLQSRLRFSDIVKVQEDIPSYYDAIFLGSDQIWSKEMCEGLDPIYYGQIKKGTTKLIGYAASAGRMKDFKDNEKQILSIYLNSLDKIGLREIAFKNYIDTELNIKSTLVCDPVFLPDKTIYKQIASDIKHKKYILYYMLRPLHGADKFVEKIAQEKNLEILVISGVKNPLKRKKYNTITNISPSDFLWYIMSAEYIITDSFHVTSFSILMHKNFYTLRKTDNNERSETLLGVAGLRDRLISPCEEIKTTTVNYSGVDEKIEAFRNESLDFIRKSL